METSPDFPAVAVASLVALAGLRRGDAAKKSADIQNEKTETCNMHVLSNQHQLNNKQG